MSTSPEGSPQSPEDSTSGQAVDIILHEYDALRDEVHHRLQFYFHLYEYYVIFLGVVIGFIIQSGTVDLVFVIPFVSLPILDRLLWDQKMVHLIDSYIRQVCSARMRAYMGPAKSVEVDVGSPIDNWFGWLDFFPHHIKHQPLGYKSSAALLFVILPLGATLSWAVWHLAARTFGWVAFTKIPANISPPFFGVVAVLSLVLMTSKLRAIYFQEF